jgi:nicotinamidase-related amidase
MERFMLHKDNAMLLIIDIQERLAQVMTMKEQVVNNTLHLLELAKLIRLPLIVTEQYPKGIGPTVKEIREQLEVYSPFEKLTFDCCGEQAIEDAISTINKRQVIVVGMETHICVLQTTLSLLKRGLYVHIVSDAVCSRTKHNWQVGLQLMRDAGAVITSTETVLFQLLGMAGTEEFKAISKRIK